MFSLCAAQVPTLTRSVNTANAHKVELYEFRIVNGGRVVQSNVLITLNRMDNKNVNLLIELVDSDQDGSWDWASLKLNATDDPNVQAAFYLGPKGIDAGKNGKDKVQPNELGAWLLYHNELVSATDNRLKNYSTQLVNMRGSANRILAAIKVNRGLQDSDIETVARAFLVTQPFFKADRDRR